MTLSFATLLITSTLFAGAAVAATPVSQLKSEQDKISYSIGVDIGRSFFKQEININLDAFMKGIQEGQKDKPLLMTSDEIQKTLMNLQTTMIKKQQESSEQLAKENKQKGDVFLTENAKKKDIIKLSSGLQYRVIKEGTGTSPKETDTVTTHYRGKLIDGTEFDSSYTRNEPATFKVNGVIRGWTEALQKMKPGAKWELFIPSSLAYGEQGVGNVIGPNSTLVFEVELLSIN